MSVGSVENPLAKELPSLDTREFAWEKGLKSVGMWQFFFFLQNLSFIEHHRIHTTTKIYEWSEWENF